MPKKNNTKNRPERLEKAYQEWKLGSNNSLKEIAENNDLYFQDLSRYITHKLEINKKK